MIKLSDFTVPNNLNFKLNMDIVLSDKPVTSVSYNSDNLPTEILYENGYSAILTYTGTGKVASTTYKNDENIIVEEWTFSYNSADLMTSSNKTV